jgi:uncharacterized membrane protein YkoI
MFSMLLAGLYVGLGADARRPEPKDLLAGLPGAVQQTIKKELGNGTIISVDKTTEDGDTTYEVEVSREGTSRSLSVEENGTLASSQVFEAELPPAVRRLLHAELGQRKPGEMYRVLEDGEISFEVDVFAHGKTNTWSFAEDGKWYSRDVDLGETPIAVQQAVRQTVGAGRVTEVSKSVENGQLSYDVELTKGGRQYGLSLNPSGKVISQEEELALGELPPPVQRTVKATVGTGTITRIARVKDADGVSYDVEARRNGRALEFTVGPRGRIISTSK